MLVLCVSCLWFSTDWDWQDVQSLNSLGENNFMSLFLGLFRSLVKKECGKHGDVVMKVLFIDRTEERVSLEIEIKRNRIVLHQMCVSNILLFGQFRCLSDLSPRYTVIIEITNDAQQAFELSAVFHFFKEAINYTEHWRKVLINNIFERSIKQHHQRHSNPFTREIPDPEALKRI